jgi:(E)-4-hydroxy-3-methylbut-2-enyl-diphosphate synthase
MKSVEVKIINQLLSSLYNMLASRINRPYFIKREITHEVAVGNKFIGGGNPITIQSMTNTETENIADTSAQIKELVLSGCELVRVTVNTESAAQAISYIKDKLIQSNCEIPLIGDFHYNGHILLDKYPECASALDKYRINPGNVGFGKRRDNNFDSIISLALKYNKPIRIGVNGGSLDKQILQDVVDINSQRKKSLPSEYMLVISAVTSALYSAFLAEKHGMPVNKIIISTKMSDVQKTILANQLTSLNSKYAIHLGLTEAGMGNKGIISSVAALSHLLLTGIGDTIRVSITPPIGGSRSTEVDICRSILQALGYRQFAPTIISCPGCGRTSNASFQEIAQEIDHYIQHQTGKWENMGLRGFEHLHVAVMGCIVNGPGESKNANIGISLPGTGESPRIPVYVDGKFLRVLDNKNVISEIQEIINTYVLENYRP